ncbi:phosphoglycerate kinase [Candidatus Pelagibacter sp.]|nr:phosphoglycerate kinase [Candidatus Pelagibacter sp.]
MKSITNLENLNNQIVLLRLDLNVPILDGKITDTNRIDKIIPTINFLLSKKAKIIIISHVGRPKGKFKIELSLKPIRDNLSSQVNENIKLEKANIFNLKKDELFKNANEKLIILENIRFYPEEENNNEKFSEHLAKLGDIYVNDAFSCSHRKHASVTSITKFIPSYSGLQINSEVEALKKITTEIKNPITCIIGGSKISTKIDIIKNLIPKFDNIVIVGAMANNILKYKGYNIGASLFEKNSEKIIEEIFSEIESNSCRICLPEDVKVGKSLEDDSTQKSLNQIENDDMILDVGSKTIQNIKSIIDNSSTILWNGPLGYFENPNFSIGSLEIAKHIGNKQGEIYSVIGGGDTVSVVNSMKIKNKFNFVSTAGGAFLEYLEGKNLPGIRALN